MEALFSNLALLKLKGDINAQTRTVIYNVLTVFIELKSDPEKISSLNLNKPRDITALLCGVSTRTVDKVKKEILQSGHPSTPRETYVKPETVTNIGNFEVGLLRRTISSFYDNGEYPTVAKILQKMQEQMPQFKCGKSSLKKILKKTGYQFKKNMDGRKQLMVTGSPLDSENQGTQDSHENIYDEDIVTEGELNSDDDCSDADVPDINIKETTRQQPAATKTAKNPKTADRNASRICNGISCNECSRTITGFRYTCVQCAAHNMCAACELRGAHAAHYVLRVPGLRPQAEVEAILNNIRNQLQIMQEQQQKIESVAYSVAASDDSAPKVKVEADPLEESTNPQTQVHLKTEIETVEVKIEYDSDNDIDVTPTTVGVVPDAESHRQRVDPGPASVVPSQTTTQHPSQAMNQNQNIAVCSYGKRPLSSEDVPASTLTTQVTSHVAPTSVSAVSRSGPSVMHSVKRPTMFLEVGPIQTTTRQPDVINTLIDAATSSGSGQMKGYGKRKRKSDS